MKLSIIILFTLGNIASAQVSSDNLVRCLASDRYSKGSSTTDMKTIYSPCSACFNEYVFSFYTKETGVVTFEIEQPISLPEIDKDGLPTYTYLSAESQTHPFGYFMAEVSFGKKKTILINYAMRDAYYIIQADHFAGSPDNVGISKTVKNYQSIKYPSLDMKKAYLYNDVQTKPSFEGKGGLTKYLSKNYKHLDNKFIPKDTFQYIFKFKINPQGEVVDLEAVSYGCTECAMELMYLIENTTGKWSAGKIKDTAITVQIKYPITLPLPTSQLLENRNFATYLDSLQNLDTQEKIKTMKGTSQFKGIENQLSYERYYEEHYGYRRRN